MNPLRIGIIGCGAAAQRYYVPAFKQYPELVDHLCLVDKNVEQAKELADMFGGGNVFDDHRAVVGQVDGVIIALPHFLHFPVTMDFLNAGVHVLCEKPLAETAEQAEQMVAAAVNYKVSLGVNNTRRMFPVFRAVADEINRGKLGTLKSINYVEGNSFAWPSETGFYVDPAVSDKGVLLDLGPHVLDTICWWLEGKPDVVSCQDDSFGGPESLIRITAKKGECDISIILNRLLELENSYEIQGELGTIRGKIFDWNRYTFIDRKGNKREVVVPPRTKTYPEFVLPVIDNFIKVLSGKETFAVSAEKVVPSIQVMEECYAMRRQLPLSWEKDLDFRELSDSAKVLVTGATGFIGCRVVEVLHRNGQGQVRAGIHQWSSAARLGRFPVDIVLMDLMDKEQIESALVGVTHIVHCAKGGGGATDQGTRNLLAAALANKVERFIHLSTTEVYGIVEGEIDSDTPFQYTGNEYNRSKIDAEKACWEYFEKGLAVTVLRPSIVYGPFSSSWTVRFANLFLKGKGVLYEKNGEGFCNLVYVDDLVRCITETLVDDSVAGKAFNVVGPEVITWNEYFVRFNEMMGLPPLQRITSSQAGFKIKIMAPVRFLGQIVKKYFMGPVKKLASSFDCVDLLLRRTEQTLKDTPSSDEMALYNRRARYKSGELQCNSIGINDGLSYTVEWIRQQGVS